MGENNGSTWMKIGDKAQGWLATVVGIAFFLLYALTAAPSIVELYDDSLEFQLVGPTFGIAHPTGYPLYTLLGGLWSHVFLPVGNWAWRMNLFSALAAAITVALLFVLTQQLVKQSGFAEGQGAQRFFPGLFAATAFGLSPLWWSQATLAEVYALHNLLVISALHLALLLTVGLTPQTTIRRASLLVLTIGLGLTHHRTIVLLGPGLLLMLWGQRWLWQPSRHWLRWLGWLLVPLLLYLYLPLRATMGVVDLNGSYVNTWAGFWQHVLALGYSGFFTQNALTRTLSAAAWGGVWVAQYGLVGLALGLLGLGWSLWRGQQRRLVLGLSAALLANLAFALAYRVGDPEVFMLPAWLAFAPLIGLGSAALAQVGQRYRRLVPVGQVLLLFLLLLGIGGRGEMVNRRHDWAIHDDAVALAKVDFPPQSRVIGLEGQITALRYMQQAEGLGQNAQGIVANDPEKRRGAIALAIQTGLPTFITQEVEGIADQYSFSGAGPLIRVWPRGQAKVDPPPQPLNVLLANDTLALTGYAVERLADAGGPTLRIIFYWQPQAALAENYKLSLRLQSVSGSPLTWPDGNAVVADHFPLRGVAPTTAWVTGEIVADVHYLPLPPTTTGPKQLYVVLYDAATVSEAGTFTIALPPSF